MRTSPVQRQRSRFPGGQPRSAVSWSNLGQWTRLFGTMYLHVLVRSMGRFLARRSAAGRAVGAAGAGLPMGVRGVAWACGDEELRGPAPDDSRQPSAVSRQPSAVSRQPSAVSRQPSAVSCQTGGRYAGGTAGRGGAWTGTALGRTRPVSRVGRAGSAQEPAVARPCRREVVTARLAAETRGSVRIRPAGASGWRSGPRPTGGAGPGRPFAGPRAVPRGRRCSVPR